MFKNLVFPLVSVFIVLVVLALVVPSFIDWSKYKSEIISQVETNTDYKLEINGPFKAAFLPYPHAVIEKVKIDSAGAQGPYAFKASVEKASVSLSLMALLGGNIAVNNVTFLRPVADIQERKWTKKPSSGSSESGLDQQAIETNLPIQIQNVTIEDAQISFAPLKGEKQEVVVSSLSLRAETLFGPYDFEGDIVYNKKPFRFSGNSGAYTNKAPISVTVDVNGDGYNVRFSGIADMTKKDIAVQGETSVQVKNLSTFNVPSQESLFIKGLLTATPQAAKIDNGELLLGKAKAHLSFNATGLGDGQKKKIESDIAFSAPINLDDFVNVSSLKQNGVANDMSSKNDKAAKKDYRFFPNVIEIPSDVNAVLAITASELMYKGQAVKDVSINTSLKDAKLKANISVKALPDDGTFEVETALKAESTSRNGASGTTILNNPSLSINGDVAIRSLEMLLSEWLELVDAKTFDNEAVPNTVSGAFQGTMKGELAQLSSQKVVLGDYDFRQAKLSYKNAEKPNVKVFIGNLSGAAIEVQGALGDEKIFNVSVKHKDAAQAIKIVKKDFKSSPALEKPFSFNAGIELKEKQIDINSLKAKLGTIDTKGTVTIDTSASVPAVKATLDFGTLDTQALLAGKTSSSGVKESAASSSGGASGTKSPWTRDAIDTAWMRGMTLDIDAKAKKLVHGTWRVDNPVLDVSLKNGVLSLEEITGKLFNGDFKLTGQASAPKEGQPLDVNATITGQSVDLNGLVKAATGQTKDRVLGQGNFDLNLTTKGLSSSALMHGLNGDGSIKTTDLVVKGIDLATLSEAISDESLTDLGRAIDNSFGGGETTFKPIDEKVTIREGNMPINDFTLESDTATIKSNGMVSFSRWFMDLENSVQLTKPEELPAIAMTLKGPLNAPQKNVTSDVIRSFVVNKYGSKLQKKIDEKLGDSPVGGIINNLLGLPQKQAAPAANDNTPKEQRPEQQQPIEQQLIRGLFDKLGQ